MTNSPENRTRQTAAIRAAAQAIGFELVGITPAVTPSGFSRLVEWIAEGHHATMEYIPRRLDAYRDPGKVLPGARSVIALAINYNHAGITRSSQTTSPPLQSRPESPTSDQRRLHESSSPTSHTANRNPPRPDAAGTQVIDARSTEPVLGRVARYAHPERDYHDTIRARLRRLVDEIETAVPSAKARGVIDTAPVLERDFATQAGLGWIGKNTMLIHKGLGSWLFLAAVLVDVELEYDEPHASRHCGTCTRCLEVCPTGAFAGPYVLDARRCISYLTIESRELPPEELRRGMGDWLFGCDLCQEVCPWNRRAPLTTSPDFEPVPGLSALDPRRLLTLTPDEFQAEFGKTPLSRPGWWGLRRNALVVLGNTGSAADLPLLHSLPPDDSLQPLMTWAITTITTRHQRTPESHASLDPVLLPRG